MRNQEQSSTSQDHRYLKPKSKNPVLIQEERKVELFAKIKRTSKYYYQGLDENGTPRAFKIEAIKYGSHSIRMNSNNYRCQDLTFWVKDAKGQLIPLAGGMKK